MALKINLYHEVLRTRKHAQYDPLRLSMFGLIGIVVAMAGWYAFALSQTHSVTSATSNKKAQFAKLEPKAKDSKREEEELTKQLGGAEILTKRIEDRFYWGPVMGLIASAVPKTVQLTHLTGDIASDAARKCTMVIEGVAAGETPRKVAEDLRVSISEKLSAKYFTVAATFRSLDDGTEKIQFENAKLDTANFAIVVTFLPKAPAEESAKLAGRAGRPGRPAPAPAPAPKAEEPPL